MTTDTDPESPDGWEFLDGAAQRTGIPIDTFRTWRKRGEGPPVYKVGKRLLLRRSEVDGWLRAHREPAA